MQQLQAVAVVVAGSGHLAHGVIPQDPKDEPIIATALDGHADIICARDAHLLAPSVQQWCEAYGIRVMDDLNLLAVLRATDDAS